MEEEKWVHDSGAALALDRYRDTPFICLGWKEEMMGRMIGKVGGVAMRQSFGREKIAGVKLRVKVSFHRIACKHIFINTFCVKSSIT